MNISIFLGAGASAAENLPIQSDLFVDYFKSLKDNDFESDMNKELYKFFKQMFDIDITKDDMDKVNFPTFEEVLGLLDLAEKRGEAFKNFGMENLSNKSDSIRFLRQYLILLMAKAIHESENRNNKYHKLLVDNLSKANLIEKTTFISANYDIHVDNTIASLYSEEKNHIMLDYGVDFTNFYVKDGWRKPFGKTIKLYKIHGSLNWLYCPICNSLTLTPYEGGVMRLLYNIEDAKCLECGETTIPIIIPPTYFKDMSNVYISNVWREVEKNLRNADILVFCGYSFPDSDIHIKYMLKRVQGSRKKPPLKIMVFNNHEGKKDYSMRKEAKRYKRFLGEDVIYTEGSFQDFSRNPLRYLQEITNI